jgi:hypothetical protein
MTNRNRDAGPGRGLPRYHIFNAPPINVDSRRAIGRSVRATLMRVCAEGMILAPVFIALVIVWTIGTDNPANLFWTFWTVLLGALFAWRALRTALQALRLLVELTELVTSLDLYSDRFP